jgi:hypothetical protein
MPGVGALHRYLLDGYLVLAELTPEAEELVLGFLLEVDDVHEWEAFAYEALWALMLTRDDAVRDALIVRYSLATPETRPPWPSLSWDQARVTAFEADAMRTDASSLLTLKNSFVKTTDLNLIAAADPGDRSLLDLLDSHWSAADPTSATLGRVLDAFDTAAQQ